MNLEIPVLNVSSKDGPEFADTLCAAPTTDQAINPPCEYCSNLHPGKDKSSKLHSIVVL